MNKLLLVALAFSVVGITALYIYTNSLTAAPIEISTISSDMIGKAVRIDGFVSSKFISPNKNTFLTIDDGSGKIIAIFTKPVAAEQFDNVEILGSVSEKDGKLSIFGREILEKP